jgi:hypothetical protein
LSSLSFVSFIIVAQLAPAKSEVGLDLLANTLVEQIKSSALEGPLAISIEGSPQSLARAISTSIIGKLSGTSKGAFELIATPLQVSDAGLVQETFEKQAMALDAKSVVRLTIDLEKNRLVARGDAFSLSYNFWAGKTPLRKTEQLTLTASAPIDMQSEFFKPAAFSETPPLSLKISPFIKLPQWALAVASFEDASKSKFILVLTSDALSLYSPQGKLVSRNPLPLVENRVTRAPFGILAVNGPRVTLWHNRRPGVDAAVFQNGIAQFEKASILEFGPLKCTPELTANYVECLDAKIQQAYARTDLRVWSTTSGRTKIAFGTAAPLSLNHTGASTLADFDGDGRGELVATSSRVGFDDELKVIPLLAIQNEASFHTIDKVFAERVKGRIVSAFSHDSDSDGKDEVFFSTWNPDGTGTISVMKNLGATP